MAVLKIKTQVNEQCTDMKKKYHDDEAVADVIRYVLRKDKTVKELVGGIAVDPWHVEDQFRIVARAYGKDFGVRLRHMVLSFSPEEGIDAYDAKNIACQVAAYYGYTYQIIWVVHLDGKTVHIHMVMNTVSYRTGMKYDGSKADYYSFQAHINAVLAPYGSYLMAKSDKAAL